MKNYFLLFSLCMVSIQLFSQTIIRVPENYQTISEALNATDQGDTVLVGPGVYVENIEWPENAVDVKLMSTEGAENTIIDGSSMEERVIRIEGSWEVDFNENTAIDGFTLTRGLGGLYVHEADITIRNLIVENNDLDVGSRAYGAGILLEFSNSKIENCIVQNNRAVAGSWAYGGGVYIDRDCNVHLLSSIVRNNYASGGGWSFGAGIYINVSSSSGDLSDIKINSCQIIGNESNGSRPYGAGLYISSTYGVEIENTVFSKNISTGSFNESSIELDRAGVTMKHCTSTKNNTGITLSFSELKIYNSILFDNQFEIDKEDWDDSVVEVEYSLVSGGYPGVGNIDADPDFIREDTQVPSLNSVCIGKGSIDYTTTLDISGADRPAPQGTQPDIGAYEINQDSRIAKVKFYDDANENGIKDANEFYVGAGAVMHDDLDSYINTDPEGIFLELEEGENTISWDATNAGIWQITSGEQEYIIDANTDNFFEEVSFGIRPVREIIKLTNAIHAPVLVCNRTAKIQVTLKNQGSLTDSGLLWLDVDDRIEIISFGQLPDVDQGNKVAWSYNNLVPGASIVRELTVELPSVNQDNQDDEYFFFSEVEITDQPGWSQVFEYKDIVRCSFDPNDKLIHPQREDMLSLIDSDMIYTVRFQNVGNYHAQDVLVSDTLDTDLDMSTFNFLATSHPEVLRLIMEENIVHFDFKGIYLPDSTTNFEASNGYVMYSISPDSTIAENTLIENTAHIYFDFNEAIVTNTTENIMVSEFPVLDATHEEELLEVDVYPNPSNSKFFFSKQIDLLTVFDARGKQILSKQNVQELDLEGYLGGFYIAKLERGQRQAMVKLLYMH